MAECELRKANGEPGQPCAERDCIYWRAVEHLGVSGAHEGCAVQYFDLLGEHGHEIAEWLLSVKERVEAAEADKVTA